MNRRSASYLAMCWQVVADSMSASTSCVPLVSGRETGAGADNTLQQAKYVERQLFLQGQLKLRSREDNANN